MLNYRPYSAREIERLRNSLAMRQQKGKSTEYSVEVDEVMVIYRTDDLTDFERLAEFVDASSKVLTVSIFHGSSRNCKKHFFSLSQVEASDGRYTITEVNQMVEQQMDGYRKEDERRSLLEENAHLKKQVEELESLNQDYHELVEEYKGRKHHLGNIDLGKLFSATLDGMLKRNPKIASKVPLIGPALAGAYEPAPDQTAPSPEEQPDEAVSVEAAPELSDQEAEAVQFLMQLKGYFNEADQPKVLTILSLLADQPDLIPDVLSLLKSEQTETSKTDTI